MNLRGDRSRRTVNWLSKMVGGGRVAFPPIPGDARILFRHRDRQSFPFLSNLYPAPLHLDGINWPTVEHYYQAQKSYDPDYRQEILSAPRPGEARRRGDSRVDSTGLSLQSWFSHRPESLRKDWDKVRLDVMRLAVAAKFTQQRDLLQRLLATGEAELVQDSSSDSYWGLGKSGTGHNHLGRILMEVRSRLQR